MFNFNVADGIISPSSSYLSPTKIMNGRRPTYILIWIYCIEKQRTTKLYFMRICYEGDGQSWEGIGWRGRWTDHLSASKCPNIRKITSVFFNEASCARFEAMRICLKCCVIICVLTVLKSAPWRQLLAVVWLKHFRRSRQPLRIISPPPSYIPERRPSIDETMEHA